MAMAFKGLNKMVLVGDKPKRTRILKDETKDRKCAELLEQITSGRVITSTEKGTYKEFLRYPDQLIDRSFQALKYGATPEQIREAGKKTFAAMAGKVDFRKVKGQIYEEGKKRGLNLSDIAATFELEDPGTRVVASEDAAE